MDLIKGWKLGRTLEAQSLRLHHGEVYDREFDSVPEKENKIH